MLPYFAAFGARTKYDIRCRLPGPNEALADTQIFVEHGEHRFQCGDDTIAAGVAEPRLLHVGGELPHGSFACRADQVALCARRGGSAEQRVVEQRLHQLQLRFLSLREGGADVGRKALLSDQLIERVVGGVDEVADVDDAAVFGVASVDAH